MTSNQTPEQGWPVWADTPEKRAANQANWEQHNQRVQAAARRTTLSDESALDRIAEWLRDPEWGVGMLEDIAEIVNETGRTTDNYPDDRPTWGRH